MAYIFKYSFLFGIGMVVAVSCTAPDKDPEKYKMYKGPLIENKNVLTLYSDSAHLKVKLTAPVQQEFEDGNSIYPQGLFVSFYEPDGRITTTLKSNYGTYNKETDNYFVRGNVVVENIAKKEELHTEELYWDRKKQKVHTDKFVKIVTPDEILTGHGLEANQDFSRYRILKPSGIFSVKQ